MAWLISMVIMFCYQHNLHSSQTERQEVVRYYGFATSIIYIVLKQGALANDGSVVLLPA